MRRWSTASSQAPARLVLATATWLGLASCAGNEVTGPPAPKPVASIIVTPGADTMIALGRTRSYVAVARDVDGVTLPEAVIRWRSSDTLVARVDSITGVVTAVANGLATIEARSGSVIGSGSAAVIQFVAAVQVTPGTSSLGTIGDTQAYIAVARDSANAIVPGVRFLWGSSNPLVATIDTLGVATMVGAGTTTISATGRGVPAYAELTTTQTAVNLVFSVEPSAIVAGNAFATAVQVEVRDGAGSVVRGARIPVTLGVIDSPSILRGTTTVTSVDGVATFSGLTLERADNLNYLRATATGIDGDTSASFQVTAGPKDRLRLVMNQAPSAAVGVGDGAFAVQVLDRFGNHTAASYFASFEAVGDNGFSSAVFFATNSAGNLGERLFTGVGFRRPIGALQLRATASFPGEPTMYSEPLALSARANFEAVDVGVSHSCGLAAGRALCWGSGLNNQLGYSTAAQEDSLPGMVVLANPTDSLIQVVAMADRSCALSVTGAVHCWSFTPANPLAGTGPGGLQFTQLTASAQHICGLLASGAVYCWGNGASGQLGNGANLPSATPVQVTGSGSGVLIFASIDAGGNFTCGVTTTGAAYCWGLNTSGQLGDSTTTSRNVPTLVAGSGSGSRVFTAISAGLENWSCGINTLGQILCWGTGRMGIGAIADQMGAITVRLVPTQALASIALPPAVWQSVSVGQRHACAIGEQELHCWGEHHAIPGEYNGDPRPAAPVRVSVAGRSVLSVTSGQQSTCARNVNGLYCWGSNLSGALGSGSTEFAKVSVPTRVVQ